MTDEKTPQNDRPHDDNSADVAAALESAIADGAGLKYVLNLYVTGMRPRSQRAIENIRRLCEEHLPGRYELKIIDIYQQPALAEGAQIIAAPTLVKSLPLPLRRLIGDMSDEGRVLVALGIEVAGRSEDSSS
ncbi:MAG: circadian clock KaiB family protein [Planctomycetaceae bacterium]|nr:circadian clock KaiB family protein [Planctomycetaceae bacterium]